MHLQYCMESARKEQGQHTPAACFSGSLRRSLPLPPAVAASLAETEPCLPRSLLRLLVLLRSVREDLGGERLRTGLAFLGLCPDARERLASGVLDLCLELRVSGLSFLGALASALSVAACWLSRCC